MEVYTDDYEFIAFVIRDLQDDITSSFISTIDIVNK